MRDNPAWVLLEVLRAAGWTDAEIDLASFQVAVRYLDQPV
jgi:hypothetical protein